MSYRGVVNLEDALTFDVSTLPALLRFADGRPVASAEDWPARRAEILAGFEASVYGQVLPDPTHLSFELRERSDDALGGKAVRQQVRVRFSKTDDNQWMDLLIHLPKRDEPVPMFVGLNFQGNHTVHPDPAIALTPRWVRNRKDGPTENVAVEVSRGTLSRRWPLDDIIDKGFGVATAYYGDLAPDQRSLWRTGVYSMFRDSEATDAKDAPGAITAWAWGLSRAVDYFATQPAVDATRISVIGHSRLGKAALWAGAIDERFAGVISNDSGCGGASLFRHHNGATIEKIHDRLAFWFCPAFVQYREREHAMPVDQHQLIALVAPRRAYVASALEDAWADPAGEFMAIREAAPAWELLGQPGFGSERTMPPVDQPRITPRLGYHIRSGNHDLLAFDWQAYLQLMA